MKLYKELRAIDVSDKIETKNGLSYLSWAYAVDQLLLADEDASWTYPPHQLWGDEADATVMVFCSVTAFGKVRTAQLPVMDHRNKPITNPDAFQVNTAMQRCLAKAIALHGIGLYIYAGEDLPSEVKDEPKIPKTVTQVETPVPSSEMSVPASLKAEGDCVDWMVAFIEDWIETVPAVEELRNFWKANKESLTRIENFSKPKFQEIEASFKAKAAALTKEI